MSRRIDDALLEPLQLFFGVDVKVELQDVRAVVVKQFFKVVDVLVTLGPYLLGDQVVDTNHQHVFVMRAVEDAYLPGLRCFLLVTPEEVMRRFFL